MNYRATKICCYLGYITQAIVINFAPLLFVIFQNRYDISYTLIGTLVSINFLTQITVDVLSVFLIDKMGYRISAVAAHFLCAAGFILLSVLPMLLPSAYLGLCIATIIYSIGAGIIEVVINPISAAIPNQGEGGLIFTHSFYCWGQLAVVLLSTLALRLFGENSWIFISQFWGIIPLINGIMFTKVPIMPPVAEERRESVGKLFKNKIFLAIIILMVAAGGAELAMAQWASAFAQNALGVDKMIGDILGPCLFAFFMGLGRTIHGVWGEKLNSRLHMSLNCFLCVLFYIVAAISKNPVASLMGCALTGYAVSIMWPGVVAIASQKFPNGSGALYSAIAIFGDLGCSIAPFITGLVASGSNLRSGLLINIIFPIMFFVTFRKLQNTKGL